MDKHDSNLEIIIDRLDKIDNKLDNFQKELLEIKYNVKADIDKLNLKFDVHTTQIKSLEDWKGRPWKDKIFETFTTGGIYSFGAIIGLSVFSILVTSFGGNLVSIVKTVITNLL